MAKQRLDTIVQERTDHPLSKAQGMIQTNKVRGTDGSPLTQPGLQVPSDIELIIDEGPKYVSRGGLKLEAGLEQYPINLKDRVCMDVGSSTGGFTDCMLQYGAGMVYAVDVGYGQLDWKLRQDKRVVVMERTNIRNVDPNHLTQPPTFFAVDCSFISLKRILPTINALIPTESEGLVLIKPQFEAVKSDVEVGGVVRDEQVHESVIQGVLHSAEVLGFKAADVIPSPLTGPAGNKEFVAHLKRGA
jgi:23S rRNA (cytidine1920-2'-O)/16S rRNA (cytidine1409-2'-O)-methyltransferase